MPRIHFQLQLTELKDKMLAMAALSQQAVESAVDAYLQRDKGLCKFVKQNEAAVNTAQRDLDEMAAELLAKEQPMAVDLRFILAVIKINGDLERIGDQAKNIARRATKIAGESRLPRAVIGLRSMAELAAAQLNDVLDAYAQRDVERAKAVWNRDLELDALEDSVFRDLLTFMMEDARNITFCTHLLFCSKNLERVGDHATNIAETVVYIVTGESMPGERPRGIDSTAAP